jgi:hypothetical protein
MVTKPKTKDVEEKVEDVQLEPLQVGQIEDIKHVIRTISWSGAFEEEGAQPGSVIEDYLNQNFFLQGYVLYKAEHVQVVTREGAPFASIMIYILVKYAQ